MDEGMEHHMDANEQNDIKPAEYQELSDFKEAPGYIPALDPISNFESFENYGADDLQEPHEGKPLEPDQTPEPIPAAEAGLPTKTEPAEADSSHFAELAAFKEMENYPEPEWTGGEEPDFSTGHWAVEPKGESGRTVSATASQVRRVDQAVGGKIEFVEKTVGVTSVSRAKHARRHRKVG